MIGSDELVEKLADPGSGFSISPLIDAAGQIGEGSIDIRLGPDIIVSPRATGATVFDPTDPVTFRKDLERRQEYVRRGIGDPFILQPGEFVIGRSLEYVTLPDDIAGEALGRSSWGRLGLVIATATLIQPGFKGTITLELANVGDTPIMLTVGLSIAQLVFEKCEPTSTKDRESGDGNDERRSKRVVEWRKRHRYANTREGRYMLQIKPELSRLDKDADLTWVTPIAIRYVLGVVGERYAGKSTVIDYLISRRQFRLYRLSQFIQEEAKARGLDWRNRSTLRQVGDEMREKHGAAVLSQLAFKRIREELLDPNGIRQAAPIVIEGFRLAEEIQAWQEVEAFRPLVVEADVRVRRERAINGGFLSDSEIADYPMNGTEEQKDAWFETKIDSGLERTDRRPAIQAAREIERSLSVRNDQRPVDLQGGIKKRIAELEEWWRSREY